MLKRAIESKSLILRVYPQLKYSKTKVLLPHSWVTLYDLAILLSVFGFPAPKYVEIIWFCNILALSLPDESFSRSASCALNLISTFLSLFLKLFQWQWKIVTPVGPSLFLYSLFLVRHEYN
jgi:hypothetical protein